MYKHAGSDFVTRSDTGSVHLHMNHCFFDILLVLVAEQVTRRGYLLEMDDNDLRLIRVCD